MVSLNITHVIFDLDGLLLDTESLYTVCYEALCSQYGKSFTYDVKQQMMGQPSPVANAKLISMLELPLTVAEIMDFVHEWQAKHFPECQRMPGVDRLVTHLHELGIPMAIATGSSAIEFPLKTQRHSDLLDKMSHVVLSSDPELMHGKPAPDIFLLAASRFSPAPASSEACLVFEDAGNGIAAGLAAGMWVVGVPDPRTDLTPFNGATQLSVIKTLEEFNPAAYGLPPFSDSLPSL